LAGGADAGESAAGADGSISRDSGTHRAAAMAAIANTNRRGVHRYVNDALTRLGCDPLPRDALDILRGYGRNG
jgi:hypothetical protein